jgi:hypothetical protein
VVALFNALIGAYSVHLALLNHFTIFLRPQRMHFREHIQIRGFLFEQISLFGHYFYQSRRSSVSSAREMIMEIQIVNPPDRKALCMSGYTLSGSPMSVSIGVSQTFTNPRIPQPCDLATSAERKYPHKCHKTKRRSPQPLRAWFTV